MSSNPLVENKIIPLNKAGINIMIIALLSITFLGTYRIQDYTPMAAPTPVSALLHAATIMVSGIFFILRLTTVVH